MTAVSESSTTKGYRQKELVLLGAGPSHIHTLLALAKKPLVGIRVTLITSSSDPLNPEMVPGLVAGNYALQDCAIPLEPLVRRSGVRWLCATLKSVNAQTQQIEIENHETLPFDWLSIDSSPQPNSALLEKMIPGAHKYGLSLRPCETFASIWPQVEKLGDTRALRIAVIGSDATAIELAMALRQRLRESAISLVCGDAPIGAAYPQTARRKLHATLRRLNISVIPDHVVECIAGAVRLRSGATLACDIPLIAIHAQAAPWLAASGLTLDDGGFAKVDAQLRSVSHPFVLCADAVSQRQSESHAVNLLAGVSGTAHKAQLQRTNPLTILFCANYSAIAIWGRYSAQGRWVWWLRNWIDRRFVARLRVSA